VKEDCPEPQISDSAPEEKETKESPTRKAQEVFVEHPRDRQQEEEGKDGQWTNSEMRFRRPEDEVLDLTSLQPLREEVICEGIKKVVLQEGNSKMMIGEKDTVYYHHETRFDNGYLVDIGERRKALQKFEMSKPEYFDFYRKVFRTMKKGEIAWGVYTPEHHNNMFHNNQIKSLPTEEAKASVGPLIYRKLSV
jgi:hypothetical protein